VPKVAHTPPEARYSGLWLLQQEQSYEDPDRFTVETAPDPGHAWSDDAPPEAVVQQAAPVMQGGGEIVTDAIIEERYGRAPADPIDRTPTRGHGAHAAPPGGSTRLTLTPPAMAGAHGDDTGAVRREVGQLGRPFKFPTEQWFGLSIEGSAAPPMTHGEGDDVLRRGLNAYSENQGVGGRLRAPGPGRTPAGRAGRGSWRGSGFLRGRYAPLVTNVQRHFKVPNRTHRRFRVVEPDVVTYVGDAPPPDRPNKYASPFTSLQRFGLNVTRTRRPGLRRSPGPWDEAVIAEAPTVSGGVSVDGLVVP
jgi:hypothetical protein